MQKNRSFQDFSLKTRITLATLFLVVITVTLLTYLSISISQQGIEKLVVEQQNSLIQRTAKDLDQKFKIRRDALKLLVPDLARVSPADPVELQKFLQRYHSLDPLFDNLVVIDALGQHLANLDQLVKKVNLAEREYFKKTLVLHTGVISKPLISKISGKKLVVMTEPLYDETGKLLLMLIGSIDIGGASFLGDIANTKVGKTGYFYIVTDEGNFVAHPDAALILKNFSTLQHDSPALKRAMAGEQGTFISSNNDGVAGLFSFAHLASTDWIVAAIYPAAEAFDPAIRVKQTSIFMGVVLLCLIAPLAWWFFQRQIDPLRELRIRIQAAHDDHEQIELTSHYAKDEIGDLAYTFDNLMQERRVAEAALAKSEKRLRAVTDNMPAMIAYIDAQERYQFCNVFYQKHREILPEQMIGKTVREVLGEALYAQLKDKISAVLRGERVSFELNADAPYHHGHLQYEYVPDIDAYGNVAGFYGMVTDVTERKNSEDLLFAEKERLRVTLNSIGDAVIATDTEGNIIYLNPVAESMTGWNSAEAIGLPLLGVFNILDEKTDEVAVDPVASVLRDGQITSIAVDRVLVHRTGKRFHIEDSAAPIRDVQGGMIGVILVFHDVSEAHKMMATMSYQATHDALTGLINRREFERRLELALQKSLLQKKQHSLLYLDLDQFKIVNDTCGHVAGDELLRQLTALLEEKLRQSDTLARLGGDEFGVLLESCETEPAFRIADLLRKTVSDFHFVWMDKVFPIGVSIGLVTFGHNDSTLADVLRMADAACYVAKDKGRNRVHVFTAEDKELAQRHGEMGWIGRIQKALDENRFVLYSQKILPLGDAEEHGEHYEMLLRMQDEDGKLVPPMAFIPAAERYGLMTLLDRWVIKTAFSQYALRHPDSRFPGTCAINLSGASFGDEHLLAYIQSQFDEYNVPAQAICFEVTETAAIANLTQATQFIRELKNRGCRISLDDFGSGMSSFAYLKHLPVDYLKIDGGFVKDMMSDPIDHAMVEAINHIGHVMGIETIAEFVENDAILEELSRMGVNFAQGYGVGKPQALNDFLTSTAQIKQCAAPKARRR